MCNKNCALNMISPKMINLVILTLMGTAAGTAIPEALFCCSSEAGVFQYLSSNETGCWNEKSHKMIPLALSCPAFFVLDDDESNSTITQSGDLFYFQFDPSDPEDFLEFQRGETCFANETDPKTGKTKKLIAMCAVEEEDESVLGYCMSVSAIFLLLTMVVYAVLPEIRDLQGKSIINACGSMGIGLGILAGSKLSTYSDMTLCAIRGFMTYFFLVASFFWINAISVQVLLSLRRPVVNNYSWKEFFWYALYAWGCPIVITVCMAIVNFHPGDHKKPGIGLNTCWFYNTKQQWYYMYSVMAILIIANICIFIYTSIHIWRLSFSSNHTKALRYKFVMILRMFTIMGITWIFEMISSLTEKSIIWFVIDVFNALQGPLIFLLLVVFRKRVIKALLKRGCLVCVAGPVEKYLAVKEDDEEGVIQHTVGISLN